MSPCPNFQYNMELMKTGISSVCGIPILDYIDVGAHGEVYRIGENKIVKLTCGSDDYNYMKYGICNLNEIDVTSRIHHPFMIKLHELYTKWNCDDINDYVALIYPYFQKGSLGDNDGLMKFTGTENDIIKALYGILCVLKHLELNGISHNDIRGDNLVLDDNGNIHVIDFGVCTYFYGKSAPPYYGELNTQDLNSFIRLVERLSNCVKSEKIFDLYQRISKYTNLNTILQDEIFGNVDYIQGTTVTSRSSGPAKWTIDPLLYIDYITWIGYLAATDLKYSFTLFAYIDVIYFAIDLFYRSHTLLVIDSVTNYHLALACLLSAHNILRYSHTIVIDEFPLDEFPTDLLEINFVEDFKLHHIGFLDKNLILKLQWLLVKNLDGCLYQPYIYHKCETLQQLASAYKDIIRNPQIYYTIDLNEWVKQYPNSTVTKTPNSKINEIFNMIDYNMPN